jgi:tRNA-dihydrouridine synthase B
MRIRDLELPSPLVIAPLAGVTDYPFRQILREYTDGLISMEMGREKGINYENQ